MATASTPEPSDLAKGPTATGQALRAPLGATAALSVALALAAVLMVAVAALKLIPATKLPPPFSEQHQDAETLIFLISFAVVLPLSVRYVPRIADRVAAGPNRDALPGLAAALWTLLIGMLVAVKASERLPWGGGLIVLGSAMLAWSVVAGLVLAAAVTGRGSSGSRGVTSAAEPIWWLAAALLAVPALAFAYLGSVAILPLLVGLVLAIAAAAAYRRVELPRVAGHRLGPAFDVAAVVLIVLAVTNLVVLHPEDPSAAFETQILHFHQNFFLGPASNVLGGHPVLVDTLSQYGVGSIDFIAGWFALVGVGNGTLGLLDSLLSGLVFAGAYLVIRAAGVSRPLATATLLGAVVVLIYGLVYPIGGLLQHGAIRFGLPMVVLLAAMAELRAGRGATLARVAMAAGVGLSSIWALEAFGYTAFTFAGVLSARAWLLPRGERSRLLLRRTGEAVAGCAIAHLAFAGATLVASGSLPDWGLYLGTLKAFLVGKVGDLTYDFSPWSPGLAVGFVLLASAAATALILKRHLALAQRERATIVALAGSTAYGIALFSYLVNRSADHIVPYVSLPALMVGALWLGMLLRNGDAVPLRVRRTALGGALALVALLVAVAWSGVANRFTDSALAHLAPGGSSTGAALDRLGDFPPISPGAPQAEGLLDRYWAGSEEALMIAEPDLEVEALARSGHPNVLPLSDPWEDSLVPDQRLPDLDAALAALQPGERILLDAGALAAFQRYRRDPSSDPFSSSGNQTIVPSGLAPLQEYALQQISRRFRLRILQRAEPGLTVAELVSAPRG